MRVLIVRHGETDWNTVHKMQGSVDTPLNETGKAQAQKIALRLRSETIDVIISSPQARALKTAEAIAQYHPSAVRLTESELREVSFGQSEGLTFTEYLEKHPALLNKAVPHHDFSFKPDGGESLEERVQKLIPVIKQWKKQYHGKTILLSTHGFIKKGILLAFEVVQRETLDTLRFGNTALTIIRPFESEQIEVFNDASHLSDAQ